jgi:hypothetical protein
MRMLRTASVEENSNTYGKLQFAISQVDNRKREPRHDFGTAGPEADLEVLAILLCMNAGVHSS